MLQFDCSLTQLQQEIYAVDTIRFVIPTFYRENLVKSVGVLDGGFKKYDEKENTVSDHPRFVLNKAFCGSYDKNCNYFYHKQGVVFEFSFPKWRYGTNYKTFWRTEFLQVFKEFSDLLSAASGEDLNFWKFYLKRVDLSYSFSLVNSLEVQRYLSYFADCTVRWKRPQIHKSKSEFETIFWERSSDSFKFYNKYKEILDHRDYHKITDEELEKTDNILRFEHTWRSKFIQSYFDLLCESEITVEQFDYSMQTRNYSFKSHLESLFKDFFRYEKIDSLDILKLEVESKFGQRYSNYLSFLNEVVLYGYEFVKNHTKKETFNKRVQKFKKSGIDLQLLSEFYTKQKENLLFIDSSVFKYENII